MEIRQIVCEGESVDSRDLWGQPKEARWWSYIINCHGGNRRSNGDSMNTVSSRTPAHACSRFSVDKAVGTRALSNARLNHSQADNQEPATSHRQTGHMAPRPRHTSAGLSLNALLQHIFIG